MKKTDGQLQNDVIAELEWEPSIDHADIGVAVNDGVVTLSGYVKTFPEKMAAEKAVRRVAGVRAIAEEIVVRFASDPKTADHEIAKRILDVFSWSVLIPDTGIDVRVEHGAVTLSGTVDWGYQRQEARKLAGSISGVKFISDSITIRQTPVASEVRQRIIDAFKRQSNLEADRVSVVTDGGKVKLGGTVRHWSERGIAERAAWAAPGVTAVEDNILVTL